MIPTGKVGPGVSIQRTKFSGLIMTIFRHHKCQRYLSLVVSLTPQRLVHAVRRKIFSNSGQRRYLVILRKILERGDFHERADFVALTHPKLKFSGNDSVITRTIYWYGCYAYEDGQARIWAQCPEAGSAIVLPEAWLARVEHPSRPRFRH